MARKADKGRPNSIAQNKRARFDYFIEETIEAGLALEGWEVKSLRAELDRVGDSKLAGGAPMIPLSEGEQALADALKKRREFEGPCPVFRWLFALRKGERSVPRCPGGVDV